MLYKHDWHPDGHGNEMCCWCGLLRWSDIVGDPPDGHGPFVPQMALDDSTCQVAH